MRFVLASTSKYRKNLLDRAGFQFVAVAPLADEEVLKKSGPQDIEELTRFLALKKAESLQEKYPNDWIVGCDQAAAVGKHLLGKPGTPEKAEKQLKALSGRWHRLVTSMAFVKMGEIPTVTTDITKIRLRELTPQDIKSYVALDNPIDCAGSYKIEKSGICLVETLKTKDPTAIEGLSVMALSAFFMRQGISLADFLKIP